MVVWREGGRSTKKFKVGRSRTIVNSGWATRGINLPIEKTRENEGGDCGWVIAGRVSIMVR